MMMDSEKIIYLSKPITCTPLRVNPRVNYGLRCVNAGSSIVTNVNNVHYVNNEGSSAYVGVGSMWEISLPSSQFCCDVNLKLLLKEVLNKQISKNLLGA